MPGIRILSSLVNLNHPQHYFHWSIFTVSIANLIIIVTMIIIFGLALILPFPRIKNVQYFEEEKVDKKDESTSKMWTAKLRNFGLKILPPGRLIPDRQPAYVSSWVYVFGVATLAALGIIIVSGTILTIGGVSWWHESSFGHFINSIHLWSVELFMAFLVIHLWGKFWMAAWRGKRVLTWMTGVLAFLFSILECFSGYLSQQNFDSQWIATNGKDAINVTGLGSFFNLMNFGQMITWHIVLIPIFLISVVVIHVLLVRIRGVSHPITQAKGRQERLARKRADAEEWRGPYRKYDIIKEGTIASIIVLGLVLALAGTLSSPDEPPVTIATWSKLAPADFMATTASELAGTSETATYGPPYNNGTDSVQTILISGQKIAGVHQKIDPAQTFVLSPLSSVSSQNEKLAKALNTYKNANPDQQKTWNDAYSTAITKVTFKKGLP
ncbi:MAG TPA: cytochrome b N-terminal domain-containing protein, partial [Patescibacteria group bacterium]|nr:cytochrome b N-terminal domain-containing protein [Patescibacteria group bacterium]